MRSPPKIDAFLRICNASKNRFPNILLYDRTRVKIKDNFTGMGDYYHASYVDSYETKKGYILAQAPFDDVTQSDFWRMVYQIVPQLVILLTATSGSDGRAKTLKFWPMEKEERIFAANKIKVKSTHMEQERDLDLYELLITGTDGEAAVTTLIHYKKWIEDREIPDNLLEFRATVKIWKARAEKKNRLGPLLLVCPTGVHRAGTFVALDIVLDRMNKEKRVGYSKTVAVLRKQRYGCLTFFEHYSQIADLIMRQAISSGIANPMAISSRK
ncbi:hypothetical protein AB6A40_008908 [Gnathostoma spinigerum]|uniref:Protein tyrosine phosphatase n=1 Tax=Gnathostoma spinigerum TaxID=75299 RepID=A0ABD6EQE9_9BILA